MTDVKDKTVKSVKLGLSSETKAKEGYQKTNPPSLPHF